MKSGYGQHFKKMKAGKSTDNSKTAPLAKNLRRKTEKANGKKGSLLLPILSGVGFVVCLALYLWEAEIENFLSKVHIGVTGPAAVAQEKTSPTKNTQTEKISGTATSGEVKAPENISSWGPDELSVLADLTRRKEKLDERERYLDQLDADLQRRMAEVEQRMQELEASRREIASLLTNQSAEDNERVDRLVETYSGMKPANAARVIAGLNEKLAISILTRMKKQNASEIMNFMEPEKAQQLTEKFAGYRK